MVEATRVFTPIAASGIALPKRNFTLRYRSNIPPGRSERFQRHQHCSAESAVALYDVEDGSPELLPTLCWQAESEELRIACGMQDRVIQMYNGLMYMDFEQEFFAAHKHGRYQRLDVQLLPPLYVAFDPRRAEFSGTYHLNLRTMFDDHKPDIVAAMSEFADLARQGFAALSSGQTEKLPALINANFDLRDRVFQVSPENKLMVEVARRTGASAKFAGSGGAIVGTYTDAAMLQNLRRNLAEIGCELVLPDMPERWRSASPAINSRHNCRQ